jgi:nucleoporin NDC1
LLSFLSALEEYEVEVSNLYVPPTPEEVTQNDSKILEEKERTRVEVARATEVIGVVSDGEYSGHVIDIAQRVSIVARVADTLLFLFFFSALKSGVADIVRTFGDKLVAFKVPPRIAKKIQSFVDYI